MNPTRQDHCGRSSAIPSAKMKTSTKRRPVLSPDSTPSTTLSSPNCRHHSDSPAHQRETTSSCLCVLSWSHQWFPSFGISASHPVSTPALSVPQKRYFLFPCDPHGYKAISLHYQWELSFQFEENTYCNDRYMPLRPRCRSFRRESR